MELIKENIEFEKLNKDLNDEIFLNEYKKKFDDYKPNFFPRILGNLLVFVGNVVYGKEPSYLKFRSVEIIARVPYQSWSSVAYTLLTIFFTNEKKAIELSRINKFSRFSHDNETMHVIVISSILKDENIKVNFLKHTFMPIFFAFWYFWWNFFLFLIKPKWSYELNFVFESHAFAQYSIFIKKYAEVLKKKEISSEFLHWYGRHPKNQYEFFLSIRNDEIIHRNESLQQYDQK